MHVKALKVLTNGNLIRYLMYPLQLHTYTRSRKKIAGEEERVHNMSFIHMNVTVFFLLVKRSHHSQYYEKKWIGN